MAVSSMRLSSYNSTLMAAPFSNREIAPPYLGMLLTSNHTIGTLNQKWFNIDTSAGDGNRMFLSCALVVLKKQGQPMSIGVWLSKTQTYQHLS